MAERAKILYAEAEENNLDYKAQNERWERWFKCSLCKQDYHGVVYCALGWACWKTYLGRPETEWSRSASMNLLANGLSAAEHDAEALSVQEAELSMLRRLGAVEERVLSSESNLATMYANIGRLE